MLMPCLIAQAICFIHLFGLQLCVATNAHDRSGSNRSIQNRLDEAMVMEVVPSVPTSEDITVYYVTFDDIDNKMRLKLTKARSEALRIGNYFGSGVNLPGPISHFTFDGDGRMQVEARDTQDPRQTTSFEFLAGKIQLPENRSLYREIQTGLLVVQPSGQGYNEWYEQMEQTDPYLFEVEKSRESRLSKCKERVFVGAVGGVVCYGLLFNWGCPRVATVLAIKSARNLIEGLCGIYTAPKDPKDPKFVWVDLHLNDPTGITLQ